MGQQNNVSRSLIIMSKLQGWDPTKIEGQPYAHNDYPENKVQKGDVPDSRYAGGAPSPAAAKMPSAPAESNQAKRTTNSNPFPGKTGCD